MQHSWQTASADVKRLIVAETDPQTARRLCQINGETREFCRERLLATEKYRVCLDGNNAAVECDEIPMFSRQQFMSLVPQRIEIYPKDPIQLTHEFYSQQYKLPTEGFAVALRKAKLMNTICAIIRPDFLVSDAAKTLPLPAYVDTALLDSVVKTYDAFNKRAATHPEAVSEIAIDLGHVSHDYLIRLRVVYAYKHEIIGARLNFKALVSAGGLGDFFGAVENDALIHPTLKRNINDARRILYDVGLLVVYAKRAALNVFDLSRLLKILFDLGYYYKAKFKITVDPQDNMTFEV